MSFLPKDLTPASKRCHVCGSTGPAMWSFQFRPHGVIDWIMMFLTGQSRRRYFCSVECGTSGAISALREIRGKR